VKETRIQTVEKDLTSYSRKGGTLKLHGTRIKTSVNGVSETDGSKITLSFCPTYGDDSSIQELSSLTEKDLEHLKTIVDHLLDFDEVKPPLVEEKEF